MLFSSFLLLSLTMRRDRFLFSFCRDRELTGSLPPARKQWLLALFLPDPPQLRLVLPFPFAKGDHRLPFPSALPKILMDIFSYPLLTR